MTRVMKRLWLAVLAAVLLVGAPATAAPNPLDKWVAQPDAVYEWKLARTIDGDGYTTFVLALTSQTWRTAAEVDRPVWTHWLTIVRPDKVTSDKGFLYITGGENGGPAPDKASDRIRLIAMETGSVVAELGQVPNQPLTFTDTPAVAREEDDLIAYAQNRQIASKDDTWIVRLAMVKSGVRAMDAIQAFMASPEGGGIKLDGFVVAGGSKRGWTAWLVAAEDSRVVAVVPLVIDVLNSEAVSRHHYEALGYFSPALGDYVAHGILPDRIGTPELAHTRDFEDPYSYRRRASLRMPKFLINAAGDEFFLPDNSQFYWPGLPEEKRLRYVPNSKHSLAGTDAVESLIAFYQAIITDTPRPRYSWKKRRDGTLVVTSPDKPRAVTLWQAANPKARDFRVDTLGKAYTATPLAAGKDGTWTARPANPATGFTAFFVELTFDGPGKYPFKFTTEVSVVPDTLPYRWADGLKRPRTTPAEREALTRPPT